MSKMNSQVFLYSPSTAAYDLTYLTYQDTERHHNTGTSVLQENLALVDLEVNLSIC